MHVLVALTVNSAVGHDMSSPVPSLFFYVPANHHHHPFHTHTQTPY